MSRRLNLPDTASFAEPAEDGALFAPSAARNADAIAKMVATEAPEVGRALEIASGTGQHVVQLAVQHPTVIWQPSDVDLDRLTSIEAYVSKTGVRNVRPPALLDATTAGWAEGFDPFDMVMLSNLLHLISDEEAQTLIRETGAATRPGGVFLLYGPFKRGGALTSDGDQRFHESLQSQDPEIGYKDDGWVETHLKTAGFATVETRDMPANNLMLIARTQDI